MHAAVDADSSHWVAAHPTAETVQVHRLDRQQAPVTTQLQPHPECSRIVHCVAYGADHVASLLRSPRGPMFVLSPLRHRDGISEEESQDRARLFEEDLPAYRVAVSSTRRLACVLTTDRVWTIAELWEWEK